MDGSSIDKINVIGKRYEYSGLRNFRDINFHLYGKNPLYETYGPQGLEKTPNGSNEKVEKEKDRTKRENLSLRKNRFLWPNPKNDSSLKSRNVYFIGRKNYIDKLDKFFEDNISECHVSLVARIRGLSGVGKSSIAREYMVRAYEKKTGLNYSCVIYIQSPVQENIHSLMLSIPKFTPRGVNFFHKLRSMYFHLSIKYTKTLIIFDDVRKEEAGIIDSFMPGNNKDSHEGVHVIAVSNFFNSNNGDIINSELNLQIVPYSNSEAIEFVRYKFRDHESLRIANVNSIKLSDNADGYFPGELQIACTYSLTMNTPWSKISKVYKSPINTSNLEKIKNNWKINLMETINQAAIDVSKGIKRISGGPILFDENNNTKPSPYPNVSCEGMSARPDLYFPYPVVNRLFILLSYTDNNTVDTEFIKEYLEIDEAILEIIIKALVKHSIFEPKKEFLGFRFHTSVQLSIRSWVNNYDDNQDLTNYFSVLREINGRFFDFILHFHPKRCHKKETPLVHLKRCIDLGYDIPIKFITSSPDDAAMLIDITNKFALYQTVILRDINISESNLSRAKSLGDDILKNNKSTGELLKVILSLAKTTSSFSVMYLHKGVKYFSKRRDVTCDSLDELNKYKKYFEESGGGMLSSFEDIKYTIINTFAISEGLLGDFKASLNMLETAHFHFSNKYDVLSDKVLMVSVNLVKAYVGLREYKTAITFYEKLLGDCGMDCDENILNLSCTPIWGWGFYFASTALLRQREPGYKEKTKKYMYYSLHFTSMSSVKKGDHSDKNYISPAQEWADISSDPDINFYQDLYEYALNLFGCNHYAFSEYAFYVAETLRINKNYSGALSYYRKSLKPLKNPDVCGNEFIKKKVHLLEDTILKTNIKIKINFILQRFFYHLFLLGGAGVAVLLLKKSLYLFLKYMYRSGLNLRTLRGNLYFTPAEHTSLSM